MTRAIPTVITALAMVATIGMFIVAGKLTVITLDNRNYLAAATVYIGAVWLLKNSVTWLTHATDRSDQ